MAMQRIHVGVWQAGQEAAPLQVNAGVQFFDMRARSAGPRSGIHVLAHMMALPLLTLKAGGSMPDSGFPGRTNDFDATRIVARARIDCQWRGTLVAKGVHVCATPCEIDARWTSDETMARTAIHSSDGHAVVEGHSELCLKSTLLAFASTRGRQSDAELKSLGPAARRCTSVSYRMLLPPVRGGTATLHPELG